MEDPGDATCWSEDHVQTDTLVGRTLNLGGFGLGEVSISEGHRQVTTRLLFLMSSITNPEVFHCQ